MTTNDERPDAEGTPATADEWLAARRSPAQRRSAFTRGRTPSDRRSAPPPAPPESPGGPPTAPPTGPPTTPAAAPPATGSPAAHTEAATPPADDDPADLPIFADTWVDADGRPSRVRSDLALRPLVPGDPRTDSSADSAPTTRGIDWDLVADYRAEASSRLTARMEKQRGRISEEQREQMGVAIIAELLKSEAEERVSAGQHAWSPVEEKKLKQALFDALFRLGRLQPLVDDDSLENIIIRARGARCDVWLEKTDGSLIPGPRVADSEDELREFLTDLGARENRPFSEAQPALDLRLPGGARLAATSWVNPGTSVVIRRHGLVTVSMEEMVTSLKACGPVLANFLAAAVKAEKSIVVSGVQGSGKTTWVRALASEIPPSDQLGTFETEFELHLHELEDRHPIVHAWEHRPGSGEAGIDGRRAGQFTLEQAIFNSFRFNLDRQIVGEVRGPEVWNMLKAMESGPGSISTTHARSADHTVEKLVSCAMEMGPQVTRELAISKLAAAIDIVMHLRVERVDNHDGTFRKERWVEEVLLIEPSPDATKGYSTTPVFTPGPDGRAVASGKLDDRLRVDLVRFGFDVEAYNAEADAHSGGVAR